MVIGKYLGLAGLVIALSACGSDTTQNTRNSKHDARYVPITDTGYNTKDSGKDAGANYQDSGTNNIPQPDASTTQILDSGTPNTTNNIPTLETEITNLITSPEKDLHIIIFGTDQDGDTLEYKFECGDGRTTEWNETNEIIHRYGRVGVYNLIAYARDRNGGETNTRLEVRVQDGETNNPPVVRLKCVTDTTDDLADCEINEEGIKVYQMRIWEEGCQDFSESYDPDNDEITEVRFYPNVTERPDRYGTGNFNTCAIYGRTGNFNANLSLVDNKRSEGRTSNFKVEVSE